MVIKIETVKGVDGKVVRTVEEFEGTPSGKLVKKKKKKGKKAKESKFLGKKLLKKPTVKIKGISAVRALQGLAASQQGQQVRDVEPQQIVQDNRSLFFREEFIKEKKEGLRFFS